MNQHSNHLIVCYIVAGIAMLRSSMEQVPVPLYLGIAFVLAGLIVLVVRLINRRTRTPE